MKITPLRLMIAALVVLALLQFYRPAKTNPPEAAGQNVESQLQPPEEVAKVLRRSCYDCHSHRTRWPWYAHVAPVSWVVADDVKRAREHLNFSEWGRMPPGDQQHALVEMCKEVEAGAMPLASYTWLHRGTRLSDAERRAFCAWTGEAGKKLAQKPAGDDAAREKGEAGRPAQ
jgi:hypothetical protein